MLHPGAFLHDAFMVPLGVSASQLARAIGVPRSRLSEVISGRRGITVDTGRRLGLYFGVSPSVFLMRQAEWDLAQLQPVDIQPADTSGFLVGPRGATPIPESTRPPAPATASVSPALLARLRAKAEATPSSQTGRMVEVTYPSGQRAIVSEPR